MKHGVPRKRCPRCCGEGQYPVLHGSAYVHPYGDEELCEPEVTAEQCYCQEQMRMDHETVKALHTWMKEQGAPEDYVTAVGDLISDCDQFECECDKLTDQAERLQKTVYQIRDEIAALRKVAQEASDDLDKVLQIVRSLA